MPLGHDLVELLGEPAYVALAEAFGGTRLYVPNRIAVDHPIAVAIGASAAKRLSDRLAPDVLIVPLARELRAAHHRASGLSNAAIARRLGITEKGVEKIFSRNRRAKDKRDSSSLPLFDKLG